MRFRALPTTAALGITPGATYQGTLTVAANGFIQVIVFNDNRQWIVLAAAFFEPA